MLKILDFNKNPIGYIWKYKDLKRESELSTGDKTLSFTYLAKTHDIKEEYYIQDKTDEYVVKEVNLSSDGFPQIVAKLNLEELEGNPWEKFTVTDSTIEEAARLAITGTGWRVGECIVTKRRSAGILNADTLTVIDKLCAVFMCERVYDTKSKTISFYEKVGEDKGMYFMRGLNLKKISEKSDTYDYYTRIQPIGKDGLTIESVNDGKNYLENYQYSNKVKIYLWIDESYEDPQALKEDAEAKLADMSKPLKSYSADIIDLAKRKPEYSILSFGLGDMVTLIDDGTGIKDEQRIVKLTEYPQDPDKNTCEIANTALTFEELQQKIKEAADIINTVVTSDGQFTGTVDIYDILHFEEGVSNSNAVTELRQDYLSISGEMTAVKATIGQIETNYIEAEEADLKYATIEQLNVTNQTVHTIEGDYADFKVVTANEFASHAGIIDNLQGDLANYKTVVAGELVTAKGWMLEGSIGSAQISSLDASKLNAGILNTALVKVVGSDGKLQIIDNTLSISDNTRVRVQVGKDASGDYTLAVWDSSGNLIWDALGATENTIQRKIIRDQMVADDANIQGYKLDIESVIPEINGATTKISGTVVQVGNKTLNVALSEQETTIQENYVSLQGYADTAANTAKTQAVSTAAADATAKANNALASAKSYADSAVDGMEIGGRNLIIGASKYRKDTPYIHTSSKADGSVFIGANLYMPVEIGETYIFQCCSDGPWGGHITNGSGGGVTHLYLYLMGDDNKPGSYLKPVDLNNNRKINSNTTGQGIWKYTIPDDGNAYTKIMFRVDIHSDGETSYTYKYWDFKAEKGTKATDWTPAPEDTESQFEEITSNLTQAQKDILTNAGLITNQGQLIAGNTATIQTQAETISDHDARITANENSISLKVSTQDFNSYKTTVTGQINTAKTEAVNTAASDATTKADNALSSAKNYTNAQITTVNKSLSTTNQEISVMKGQIALKVEQTDIDKAVSNIQIGGRNLLRNTSSEWKAVSCDRYRGRIPETTGEISLSDYGLKAGDTVTLGFYVKTTSGKKLRARIEFYISNSDRSSAYGENYIENGEGYVYVTTVLKEGYDKIRLWVDANLTQNTITDTTTEYVKCVMLEKATSPSNWTPAPEDTEESITTISNKQSEILQTMDSITSRVSSVESTQSTQAGNITNLTTRMTSAEQKLTKDSIVQTVGDYYTTSDDVKEKLDSIQIGGRNLQLGSQDWANNAFWSKGNASISNGELTVPLSSTTTETHFIDVNLEDVFTVSVDVKSTASYSNYVFLIEFFNSTGNRTSVSWIKGSLLTDWQRISKTFSVTDTAAVKMRIGLRSSYGYANTYRLLKIEKGTKATDWTPAPEDIDFSIDSISTRVTNAETTIAQHTNQIALTVKEADVTGDYLVGKINLSSTTAKIAAKNINMEGYVTLTNLSTAGQTSINGANIKTGIISADRIDVNGLFAKDITATGTIRGVNLVGAKGSFSGSITANSGTIGGWNITDCIESPDKTMAFSTDRGIVFGENFLLSPTGLVRIHEIWFENKGINGELSGYITGLSDQLQIHAGNKLVLDTPAVSVSGELTVNNLIKSTCNGNTVQIGSNNEYYCHFVNSDNRPFYFNRNIDAVGGFTVFGTSTRLVNGALFVGNTTYGSSSIELFGPTPFIDFHWNNSTDDHTSRIIAWSSGTLTCHSSWDIQGGDLYLMNGRHIYLSNSNGSATSVLQLNSQNNFQYAYGGYANGFGITYVNGNEIRLRSQGAIYVSKAVTVGSDSRLKHDVNNLGDTQKLINAYMDIDTKTFIFNKGDGRIETGIIAQDAIQAMEKNGLDWTRYGLVNTFRDEDEDNIEYYSVGYEFLNTITMHLTQKHENDIEDLKKKYTEALTRIVLLEAQNQIQQQQINQLQGTA